MTPGAGDLGWAEHGVAKADNTDHTAADHTDGDGYDGGDGVEAG